jgi:hypothetical protein
LGLNCYFKMENPRDHRIEELFAQGRHVRDDDEFGVAFVTSQGVPEKYGTNRRETDLKAIDALRSYIGAHSPVEAPLRGSFVAI